MPHAADLCTNASPCGNRRVNLIFDPPPDSKRVSSESAMCNLYSVTKGQSAIWDLFAVKHDRAGNLPPLPGIFSIEFF